MHSGNNFRMIQCWHNSFNSLHFQSLNASLSQMSDFWPIHLRCNFTIKWLCLLRSRLRTHIQSKTSKIMRFTWCIWGLWRPKQDLRRLKPDLKTYITKNRTKHPIRSCFGGRDTWRYAHHTFKMNTKLNTFSFFYMTWRIAFITNTATIVIIVHVSKLTLLLICTF